MTASRKKSSQPFVYRISRLIMLALLRIWCRYRVHGVENVPESGGCLIVSNHASFLDPPALGCGISTRPVHYMARDTLARNPFIRWLFRKWCVILIDRERGDVGALRSALKLLSSGEVVGLFPEGTRTRDGRLQKAKAGVGFLVAKAGVPVVPAYISGTFRALPRGRRFPARVPVEVFYGQPISVEEIRDSGADKDAFGRISELIMERIARLQPDAGVDEK